MEYIDLIWWIVIGLVIIALLFGLRDWLYLFVHLWYENGKAIAFYWIGLAILFICPAITKDYAPNYHGLSIWVLIMYIAIPIGYRLLIKGTHDEED